jgi:hypothetical protein
MVVLHGKAKDLLDAVLPCQSELSDRVIVLEDGELGSPVAYSALESLKEGPDRGFVEFGQVGLLEAFAEWSSQALAFST